MVRNISKRLNTLYFIITITFTQADLPKLRKWFFDLQNLAVALNYLQNSLELGNGFLLSSRVLPCKKKMHQKFLRVGKKELILPHHYAPKTPKNPQPRKHSKLETHLGSEISRETFMWFLKHLAIQHLLDLLLQVLRVMSLIRKKIMMIWIYMARLLSQQDDFVNQTSMVETLITEAGNKCLFLPKFHCELNSIEMVSQLLLTWYHLKIVDFYFY